MIERNVYISLGSNLGNKYDNLTKAIELLSGSEAFGITERSGMYRTAPVGGPEQNDYLNMVVRAETSLDPFSLLGLLKKTEKVMGREKKPRDYPRLIDLDLVFYGNRVISSEDLIVPHPRAHEREFVMLPMGDIDPEFVHPLKEKSITAILRELW